MNKPSFVTPIIKMTESCNFSCEYCRYAQSDFAKQIIEYDDVLLLIKKCMDYNKSNGVEFLHVIFHGGEPLLWGKQNFKKLIKWQKEQNFSFVNSIQTNGYLVDSEWCDVFLEGDFDIGVSIDGPANVNGHKMDGKLVDEIILKNISLLDSKGCKYGILSVITDKHTNAKAYYDFLVSNNIHSVGLCYCFQNGEDAVNLEVLSKFMRELFDLYFYGEFKLSIREFNCAIERLIRGRTTSCHFGERCACGRYFSVLPNGNVKFCDSYNRDENFMGNLLEDTVDEIVCSEKYEKIVELSKKFCDSVCKTCEVYNVCGGGCYRHDSWYNGQYKNYFCDVYKSFYGYLKDCVTNYRIQREGKDEDTIF